MKNPLASHHLYGSSRLGIDQYWPTQFNATWDYKTGIIDSARLLGRFPWYSYSFNSHTTVNEVTPMGYNVQGFPSIATHTLGQKQYEETNQLGNVMATISDKRYIHTASGRRTYFSAALPAVYDYYPYGMPMKERTAMDTSGQAMYSTQQVTTPNYVGHPVLFICCGGPTFEGGTIAANQLVNQQTQCISIGDGGLSKSDGGIWPGVMLTVQVDFSAFGQYFHGGSVEVWDDSTGTLQASAPITGSPHYVFQYLPLSTHITIKVLGKGNPGDPNAHMLFTTNNVMWKQLQGSTTYSQAVVISNKLQDRYEFGFNGKCKDNEIAGVGNSYDYGMRNYNPRIARPISVDPLAKKYPMLTPYQFFSNNPILNVDLDGLEGISYREIRTDPESGVTTAVRRVIEADVYIAVNKKGNRGAYNEAEAAGVEYNMYTQYNAKPRTDEAGLPVFFKFNFKPYDPSVENSDKKAYELKKVAVSTTTNFKDVPTIPFKTIPGVVLSKDTYIMDKGKRVNGVTESGNRIRVDADNRDPYPFSMAENHEMTHFLLGAAGSTTQHPNSVDDHSLGGWMQYVTTTVDDNNQIISQTKADNNLSDQAANAIIQSVPRTSDQPIK